MKLEDLIVDKFYMYKNISTDIYYFKYKGCNKYHIFCDKYQLVKRQDLITYKVKGDIFCDIGSFNKCTIVEIDLGVIIDYLPKNHIERKYYIRRKKIEKMLSF